MYPWLWWHTATALGSQDQHLWSLEHANYPVLTPVFTLTNINFNKKLLIRSRMLSLFLIISLNKRLAGGRSIILPE
jgi:hypothetical protein